MPYHIKQDRNIFEILLFSGLSVYNSDFCVLKYQKCEIAKKLREALEMFIVGFIPVVDRIKVLYCIFQEKLSLPNVHVLTDKYVLGKCSFW